MNHHQAREVEEGTIIRGIYCEQMESRRNIYINDPIGPIYHQYRESSFIPWDARSRWIVNYQATYEVML